MPELDNLTETERQAEILTRMKALRSTDSDAPTETPKAIDVNTMDDVDEPEVVQEPIETPEVETNEDTEEPLYYEIDGEEISLSDIRGWREGNLRQSDYTKKTQETAEQRKAVEALQLELSSRSESLDEVTKALESMLFTNEVDYDVDESGFPLYEDDYGKHQKHLHNQQQIRNQLSQAQLAIQQQRAEDLQRTLQSENQLLMAALPTWADPKQRQSDLDVINSYIEQSGISKDKVNNISDHKDWLTHLYAAKWIELQNTKTSVTDKVVKAPKVIKPTGKLKPTATTNLEQAKAKLARSGSKEDFMAAMKAMRG